MDIWFFHSELPTDGDTLAEVVHTPGSKHLTVGSKIANNQCVEFSFPRSENMMTLDVVDGSYEFGTQANPPRHKMYLNYFAQQMAIGMRYYLPFTRSAWRTLIGSSRCKLV